MDFLRHIYKAARGLAVDQFSGNSKPKTAKKSKLPMPLADDLDDQIMDDEGPDALSDNFRIYFPTHDTVASSKGGTDVTLPYVYLDCC